MPDDQTPHDPTQPKETGTGARVERQDFKRSATSVKRQREVIEAAIVTARKAPGQKELARRQATLKWAK